MLSRLGLLDVQLQGKHAELHVCNVVSIFDCRHDLLGGMLHYQHCSLKALDIEVFLQVKTDLRSSFDLP